MLYIQCFPCKRIEELTPKPSCLSERKIQFHPPRHIQQVLFSSFYSNLPQREGNFLIVPDNRNGGLCSACGLPWSSSDPIEENWVDQDVLLFTFNKILPCTSKYIHAPMSVHKQVLTNFKINKKCRNY